VLVGLLSGHVEEDVNEVNAPHLARERGIGLSEITRTETRDFTDLVRVSVISGDRRHRVAGTTLGRQHRPHLVEAWGQRFNVQIDDDHIALFRYRDMPGMMGRAGTCFGRFGVNINSAAVGHVPQDGNNGGAAVMVLTTDNPVPQEVIDEILATEGFFEGRSVALR
jgi:D-3-phosphoglycerate dehydrogenase